MAVNVFLDANVVLDFTLKRAHYPVSKQILQLAVTGLVNAHITPATLHIMSYILQKEYSINLVKELLKSLLVDVKVADATHETSIMAISSEIEDIEDALQYFTAIQHKMDYFLTWDKVLLKKGIPILPIITPEGFLQKLFPG